MNPSTPSIASTRLLLGVSGGIAAYKAADLVRRLREAGFEVRVVMTDGATRFVTPLTFQAVSGHPVRTSLWDEAAEAAMGHIELARWAERILIAPASADVIARLAHGMANDLLTTLCLASAAPLAITPAMNRLMWAHPATQTNVRLLQTRGVQIFGPGAGEQACGETGEGRMLEPLEIVAALQSSMPDSDAMSGASVVVSAGPTFEDIDPVRFIGNRSSGRMGFAIAEAAARAGARVTLVAGPVHLPTPARVTRVDVRSARAMRDAVLHAVNGATVYIGAAAVADFRPRELLDHKHKKQSGASDWQLDLVQNPDIIAEVAALPNKPLVVGFAAETKDIEHYAKDKLARKKLDLIVANDVSAGQAFEREDNALHLFWHGGEQRLARASKTELARQLVSVIAERLNAKP